MKVLYAAGPRLSARFQLERIYYYLSGLDNINLKIAAYKISSPNINIDYTIDSIHHRFDKVKYNDNENFQIYCDLLKNEKFDLIISDFCAYTSYAAVQLGIKIWQVSSLSLLFGLTPSSKGQMKLAQHSSRLYSKDKRMYELYKNMTYNSDRNYVYSHYCDIKDPPELQNNFYWIRPYFIESKESKIKNDLFGYTFSNHNDILKVCKNASNSVLFANNPLELTSTFNVKPIDNYEDMSYNLCNSNIVIAEANSSILSDAYYNKKKTFISQNINDIESAIGTCINKYYNLSENLSNMNNSDLNFNLNKNFFLHERIQ